MTVIAIAFAGIIISLWPHHKSMTIELPSSQQMVDARLAKDRAAEQKIKDQPVFKNGK